MLIPNQYIKTIWHYKNKEHFENKGYKFTAFRDELIVKAEDLSNESHEKVYVQCDGCGAVFQRSFRHYIKEHDKQYGDCCRKCNRKIAMRTNKERYGVEWCLKRDDFKQKQKDTCLERYGVEYISQNKEFRDNVKSSCLEKYGVENVSMLDDVKDKKALSFYKNGTCPTSKPQLELYKILKEMYGNCELNYPVGRCSLDCMVVVDGVRIDVEFDGVYWHRDTEDKDRRRNYYVIKSGYKVLRFFRDGQMPTREQIKSNIDILVNTDKHFIKIDMV